MDFIKFVLNEYKEVLWEMMQDELARDALAYFWRVYRHLPNRPRIWKHGYHAIWRNGDFIYFHINSIVSYCHETYPQYYADLTAAVMRRAFPDNERINFERHSYTYRWITYREFAYIIHETRNNTE